MAERETVKQGLRWKIFARDGFACRYCGLRPPEAILHVDHVKAVSAGGDNDEENLVTACQDCNIGKGAKLVPEATRAGRKYLVPLEHVQKVAAIEVEFGPIAKRLYQFFIRETKAYGKKGQPADVTMILLAMAAMDAAALVYFRLSGAKTKADFLAMCSTAYDEHRGKP